MTLLSLPPTTTPTVASGVVHYAAPSPASSPYINAAGIAVIEADAAPVWLATAVGQLNELLALRADWDTYGAQPIRLEHVVAGLTLLQGLADVNSPMPAIVPTVARGIQFEWDADDATVEARVDDDGRFVYVRDEHGSAEGPATPALVARAANAISSTVSVA